MPKSLWNLIVVILAVENVQGATYTFSGIIVKLILGRMVILL